MNPRKIRSTLPLLALIILVPDPSRAEWIEDGAPVCVEAGEQEIPRAARDGAGGWIVTWRDSRGDIYAQRIDGNGNPVWMTNGVVVCDAGDFQGYPAICSDDAGGAIIAWEDRRVGIFTDIYAQRIDADGNILWTEDGVAVCTAIEYQERPEICVDGAGGAIIVWRDFRGVAAMYAQRLDTDGTFAWSVDGALVDSGLGYYHYQILPVEVGGAVVVWEGSFNIYAQRLDPIGGPTWTAGPAMVCTHPAQQDWPKITLVGATGFIAAWTDWRGPFMSVYAQGVNWDGSVRWTTDGIPVCDLAGNQIGVTMVADGVGGAILTWLDARDDIYYDIYTQRLDGDGNYSWTPDGVPVCTVAGQVGAPVMAERGQDGAIVAWGDLRGGDYDIYAQRLDLNGNTRWEMDGVVVSAAQGHQRSPAILADELGGALLVWSDARLGNGDIYAQRLNASGYYYHPHPDIDSVVDVPSDQGGVVTVTWDASQLDVAPETAITHYSVWRSLDGAELSALVRGESPPRTTNLRYAWEWLADMDAMYFEQYSYTAATLFDSVGADPGYHHFLIVANTANPSIFYESQPDSGYSVDNLSPDIPQGVSGSPISSPETGLELTWNPNQESDLSHYSVYRGTDADFVPGPENALGMTTDTALIDEDWTPASYYFYKVSAMDIHGNESGFALLTPDDIVAVSDQSVPRAPFLSQNVPNPFNPSTMITFGVQADTDVTLAVYDVSGRLVRMLANRRIDAGSHVVRWNGTESGGRAAASGVYFCRLRAGNATETVKMTLSR